ncbi:hypothetical protein ACFX5U_11655 [Sphingobacterium sp. SG20118]|uniref:hypothetical protein n=1 Tax=Sphingobacterium sp. SG20118 TaxID=3367156 RepID=UPI0037DFC53E
MRRYTLLFLLVLSGLRALPQAVYSNIPDSAAMFPKKYGTFERYAFVLNGKVIEQQTLVNNPESKLNNILPYPIKLEGKRYPGAVYFHSEDRYAPPVRNADHPAYFINGRQVSPYQIRLAKMEAYNRIAKSLQDTTINGTLYQGSVFVDTDEDFFVNRMTIPEIVRKYTGLPLENIIVHWRSSTNRYSYEDEIGTIIENNFPLYSFTISNLSVKKVAVDCVRFAQGERYVVHLIDNSYNWSNPKATSFFEEPLAIDTLFPCYVPDFDKQDYSTFTHSEIDAKPYKGLNFYLNKLASTMGLPAVKPSTATQTDSITVQFLVLKDGMIANLKSLEPGKPGHVAILNAIKKNACVWSPAIMGSRPILFRRKMIIFYSKDKKGNIQSLDGLEFRYNFVQAQNNT